MPMTPDLLRQRYPKRFGDKSDAYIVDQMSRVLGADQQRVARSLGLDARNFRQNETLGQDVATGFQLGAAGLPDAVAGILDILNPLTYLNDRAYASETWDRVDPLSETKERLAMRMSPQTKQARADSESAWDRGLVEGAKTLGNPRVALPTLAESVPAMLLGGLGGAAVRTGAAAALPAGHAALPAITRAAPFVGEGGVAAGYATENMLDSGVAPSRAAALGAVTGAGVGAIGAGVGIPAGRLGFGDLDASLAGAGTVARDAVRRPMWQRVPGTAGVEATQEGLQSPFEQMVGNVGTGAPLLEGTGRAAVEGAFYGAAMGGPFGLLPQGKAPERPLDLMANQDREHNQGGLAPPAPPPLLRDQLDARLGVGRAGMDRNSRQVYPHIFNRLLQEQEAAAATKVAKNAKRAETKLPERKAPPKTAIGAQSAPQVDPLVEVLRAAAEDPSTGIRPGQIATKSGKPRPYVAKAIADYRALATASGQSQALIDIYTKLQTSDSETALWKKPLIETLAAENDIELPKPPTADAADPLPGARLSSHVAEAGSLSPESVAPIAQQETTNGPAAPTALSATADVRAPAGMADGDQTGRALRPATPAGTPPAAEQPAEQPADLNGPLLGPEPARRAPIVLQSAQEETVFSEAADAASTITDKFLNNPKKRKALGLGDKDRRAAAKVALDKTFREILERQYQVGDFSSVKPGSTSAYAARIHEVLSDALGVDPAGDPLVSHTTVNGWLDAFDGQLEKRMTTLGFTPRRTKESLEVDPTVSGIAFGVRRPDYEGDMGLNDAGGEAFEGAGLDESGTVALTETEAAADAAPGAEPDGASTLFASGAEAEQYGAGGAASAGGRSRLSKGIVQVHGSAARAVDPRLADLTPEQLDTFAEEQLQSLDPTLRSNYIDRLREIKALRDTATGRKTASKRQIDAYKRLMVAAEALGEKAKRKTHGGRNVEGLDDPAPAMTHADYADFYSRAMEQVAHAPKLESIPLQTLATAARIEKNALNAGGVRKGSPEHASIIHLLGKRITADAVQVRTDSAGTVPAGDAGQRPGAGTGDYGTESGVQSGDGRGGVREESGSGSGESVEFDADGNPVIRQPKRVEQQGRSGLKRKKFVVQPTTAQFGTAAQVASPVTRAAFEKVIRSFIGRGSSWRVHVFDTGAEAVADAKQRGTYVEGKDNAYGWVEDDPNGVAHAYFVLDRISAGTEVGKFLHEVGAHLGMERLLGTDQLRALHSKLQDWAAETLDGGNELQHRIMERVLVRLDDAGLFEDDADAAAINSELIAYFVEEAVAAGVDPMAMDSGSELGRWLRQLWAAFKAALRRLRFTNLERLSPSDIVALAAGAARVELAEDGALSAAQQRPETRETAVSFGVDSRSTRDNLSYAKQAIRAMPEAAQGPALLVWETIADAANKGVNALSFTRDLVDRMGDKLPAARRLFEALRAAQADRLQREKAVSDIISDFDRLPAAIKTAVNAYLRDSTEKQAWGYQPPWRTQPVAIDDAMKARFEALPEAARETIIAVNKHGHDTLREKRTAMNRRIVESFDRRIARDPARAEELEAAKAETLRSAGVFLTELDGPYAPLKRFGKYVVVGMSARYAAELEKAKRTGDTATLDSLKTDGKHYSVHFAESRLEAAKLKDGLIQRGLQADTWQKSKFKQEFAVDMRAFDQLRAAVQSEADGAESKQARQAAAAMEALVDDLILQSLAEHHARQANQQRRGIKGFDQDMMRAFATQGQADAFFLANLDNGREINAALFEMDKQVRTPSAVSREEKANLANHMFDVYTRSATHVDTPIQDNLAMFSSVWFLLLSPAYYMQNAMQPILMTLPYLTKDVSYTSASRALVDGYRAVAPMVRGKVNFESFDIDSLAPDDRNIVQALIGRNIIDVTIETELGGFSHAGSNRAKRAMTALRRLPAKLEMINRVSSALASYKLAREKLGKDHAGALDYAEKVTAVTHGDYSQLNAPTLFTSTPLHKLLFQFRKFQMIQIAYMVRLANQALVGLTPEERAGAVKALAFTLGHQAVLAGAMGFPAVTLASFFVSMMTGGDDEPDSLEKKAREGLLALGFDETARDLILNGVPGPVFGSTITSKIGMSNMLSLFPFSEWGVDSREGVEGLIAASMGPMASLGMTVADGLGLIGQGELYKGMEKLVPKGLRDVMASARMADEGIVDRRDTTVMQREDLATFDLISNALGLPTKVQTDRWFTQREKFAYETYFNERTAQLKREYVRAFRDGRPRYEIEREWRNLQAAKRRNGFRTQSFSDLRNALRENRERERNTAGGVVYDGGSRKFTERLSTL